ncbi:MAG: Rrf2 family transcriptional regulator [Synergistaceae bacterium]|nr:Rrf2 family transcriptional regulator [Synergistaceae bacterium]
MQISSRFTIAVHILTCTDYFSGKCAVTSEFLAGSIGVNAVIVRRIILQLKAAGMIDTSHGKNGVCLLRPLEDITLYDVYSAVEAVSTEGLFHFHENPNPDCPVGRNIHAALDESLAEIQEVLEDKLRGMTVKDIADRIT